ncbi:MAG: hypothetical protein R3C03_23075 [Pirellulaceae bacterium]
MFAQSITPNTMIRRCLAIIFFVSLFGLRPVWAQDLNTARLMMTVTVDPVGKTDVNFDLKMPDVVYAGMKEVFGDAFHVIRSMESSASWLEIKKIDARFDDPNCSVIADCEAVGMLRTVADGRWTYQIDAPHGAMELLDIEDNTLTFAMITDPGVGMMRMYTRIVLPAGAKNIEFDTSRGSLNYDFEPELNYGDQPEVRSDLIVREQFMSSLAKLYGVEQSDLFAAKNIFSNKGDQKIYDYKVRFRIDGYSSWSPWKRCRVVYPGQEVLDYFYPVMDVDRLAELTGTRHAMIETEFEYTTEDGETYEETDARRIQILSRNEVFYATREDNDVLNWFERYDLAPAIVTAFTSGTDPVMQQFAGRISALAGGPNSSGNPEHAVIFLNTMWLTLQANHLSYQTPPTLNVGNHFGQHVKYGRDVLRNRAGTCIDLSILWASAAEAVGLKPYIAIIPGHAFPVVELPNGTKLAIESTRIGTNTFEEAVEEGNKTLAEAQENGLIMLVDIESLRSEQDIRSLDLPSVSEDIFVKWGYNLDSLPAPERVAENTTPETQPEQQMDSQPENQNSNTQVENDAAPVSPYIGDWKMEAVVNGERLNGIQRFKPNGDYYFIMTVTHNDGSTEDSEEVGSWSDNGKQLMFDTDAGKYAQNIRWSGDKLEMQFPNSDVWVTFERLQVK